MFIGTGSTSGLSGSSGLSGTSGLSGISSSLDKTAGPWASETSSWQITNVRKPLQKMRPFSGMCHVSRKEKLVGRSNRFLIAWR